MFAIVGWLQGESLCACVRAVWSLSDHTKEGSLSVFRQHVRPLRVVPEEKPLERVYCGFMRGKSLENVYSMLAIVGWVLRGRALCDVLGTSAKLEKTNSARANKQPQQSSDTLSRSGRTVSKSSGRCFCVRVFSDLSCATASYLKIYNIT